MTDYTDTMLIVLIFPACAALIMFIIYHPRKTLICIAWMVVIITALLEFKRMI